MPSSIRFRARRKSALSLPRCNQAFLTALQRRVDRDRVGTITLPTGRVDLGEVDATTEGNLPRHRGKQQWHNN
jgi:hypothetical protein